MMKILEAAGKLIEVLKIQKWTHPKRPQTKNDHKLESPQTKRATDQEGHKPNHSYKLYRLTLISDITCSIFHPAN